MPNQDDWNVVIVTRNCTVPNGTVLFFPIANAEASTIEGNGTTEAELCAAAKVFQDFATNMSGEIDGVAIRNLDAYRVQSPLYTFGPLPDNNIPQEWGLDVPAGDDEPLGGRWSFSDACAAIGWPAHDSFSMRRSPTFYSCLTSRTTSRFALSFPSSQSRWTEGTSDRQMMGQSRRGKDPSLRMPVRCRPEGLD